MRGSGGSNREAGGTYVYMIARGSTGFIAHIFNIDKKLKDSQHYKYKR
ncbi:hypothetical protein MNV_1140010 [Candidatus Methanoperedens nitroreducens]|uniref:Uncharacterized protein n=1 Tax=Candidatus Methanoperedens nitratireducens TaxID=1392998 RepID=A0A284VJ58_9EURY|nr:hypothetical protein MNV_1140010 [Candidatus Methanoperedens nitroreducens]